ncbi:hypothetical protein [Adhaeribacter radiodurans]|uniref:Uncharacterized protein n=1 Tax=Adhaeribacter radiodurans TaxID=2745197 RepID=A0A7L7L1D6_9BACT|nr:hypothetical protein [Adhaeribacter radiodurans]QMU26598.1 hypothetical protein HUW48_00565 [Adhaeribacter radiodurans]
MTNKKSTSSNIAKHAAQVLSDPYASSIAKTLAGSALSQVNKGHQTGSKVEDIASKALSSSKYSNETKVLAASVLSQSNKGR